MFTIGNRRFNITSVHIAGNFCDNVGKVIMNVKLINSCGGNARCEFRFELSDSSVIDGFELQIGNRRLIGVVNEKSISNNNHTKALEEGHRSVVINKYNEVYYVNIGNVEAEMKLI